MMDFNRLVSRISHLVSRWVALSFLRKQESRVLTLDPCLPDRQACLRRDDSARYEIRDTRYENGVSVVAALIAVMLLGALGAGLAYLAASGHQTRIQQVTGDQAFYTVQAGMEYGLGQIIKDSWTGTAKTMHFSGEPIAIARAGGVMTVSSTEVDAAAVHSISDPVPPVSGCLTVNAASASISGNTQMIGITLSRKTGYTGTVIITSMTGTTWTPNNGELLEKIQIAGGNIEFSDSAGSGGTFNFGSNVYTISDSATHNLSYIEWNSAMTNHNFDLKFNYTCDGTPESQTVAVSITEKQSDHFSYNSAACQLVVAAGIWKRLEGCTISNSDSDPVTIKKIAVSWTPATPSRQLTHMRVNGNILVNANKDSGEVVDVDHTVPGSTTHAIDYYLFSDEMLNYNYSILWTFADGSTAVTPMTLFASNQNTCLSIVTSGASISGDEISGLTVENTCGADIGMTSMSVSWSGETTRRLSRVEIDDVDGANAYTGNYSSGDTIDFGNNDLYYPNGLGAKSFGLLRFNNAVTGGLAFTIAFTMSDGTTKTQTFTPSTQAQHLVINTASASLTNGSIDLVGITIRNATGSTPIIWDRVEVSWSPTSGGRKIEQIVAGGVTVWSGSDPSGKENDINPDVTLNVGQTKNIDRIRFNGNMSGRTFTIKFIMKDASFKTTPSFSP